MQIDGNPDGTTLALTAHPFQGAFNEIPAFILLNDGGFDGFLGFVHTPETVTDWLVLEHEAAHYLGRFTNVSFGTPPNQRFYDSGGHVPQFTNGMLTNNLLRPFVPRAYPLTIPGTTTSPQTEKQVIWDRIDAGLWNAP